MNGILWFMLKLPRRLLHQTPKTPIRRRLKIKAGNNLRHYLTYEKLRHCLRYEKVRLPSASESTKKSRKPVATEVKIKMPLKEEDISNEKKQQRSIIIISPPCNLYLIEQFLVYLLLPQNV